MPSKNIERVCPGCNKKKTYPRENTYCSPQCYQSQRVPATPETAREGDLAKKVHALLKKGAFSIPELASRLDRGPKQIDAAIKALRAAGFQVHVKEANGEPVAELHRDVPMGGVHHIDRKIFQGNEFKFGFMGDTHLASRWARVDALEAMYDIYAAEGITTVFHGGNLIDGECRFNKFDLLAHGIEGQCALAATQYPQRKGITTKFIAGDDHEGWYVQREGVDIGRVMEDRFRAAGRDDLKYIGYMEADIKLPTPDGKGQTWIRLIHPGGGSAYALSYAAQKLVESFQGGEKPAVLLIGHYHKMDFCLPREVFCVQGGCFQDQTPFMRKNKLQAHVGGWICRLVQAPDGHVSRFSAEFVRFYDRGFYDKGEKFPRW